MHKSVPVSSSLLLACDFDRPCAWHNVRDGRGGTVADAAQWMIADHVYVDLYTGIARGVTGIGMAYQTPEWVAEPEWSIQRPCHGHFLQICLLKLTYVDMT